MVSRFQFVIARGQCPAHRPALGQKTLTLARLADLGHPVPPFVAVPATLMELLWPGAQSMQAHLEIVAAQVRSLLPAARYAVRSSALAEDSRSTSKAGLFHSAVDVPGKRLETALAEVLEQATQTGAATARTFSLLIQEYIQADFSGVLFSRDPLGGRHMVIEYAEGACREIVSGECLPQRCERFHGTPDFHHNGRSLEGIARAAESIEQHFGFAQDIEWCFGNGQWWILQSRPITSLSQAQFDGMRYLDALFDHSKPRLFERTAIGDVAPRPCPATYSLLQKLYEADGPVARVYQRYGIRYESQNFLVLVGNELFCDQEEERRTLFPAQELTPRGDFRRSSKSLIKLYRTLKNSTRFLMITGNAEGRLRAELQRRLSCPLPEAGNLQAALRAFLLDYEIIFETNLLADLALRRLSSAFSFLRISAKSHLSEMLSGSFEQEPFPPRPTEDLIGNSWDFLDEAPFHSVPQESPTTGANVKPDFDLVGWKHEYLLRLQRPAARLSRLREVGRWLTVRHVDRMRSLMVERGRSTALGDPRRIFLFSIPEIIDGHLSDAVAEERISQRRRFEGLEFPSRIGTVFFVADPESQLGVSPGRAEGRLVSEVELDTRPRGDGPKKPILFAPALAPHLIRHFPNIGGIVAERGGMLSHLAIMAREHGIPAVVHRRHHAPQLAIGNYLEIDGATGTISLIPDAFAHEKP